MKPHRSLQLAAELSGAPDPALAEDSADDAGSPEQATAEVPVP